MERMSALVVFFLGVAIMWQGRGLSFGSLTTPGPGFFPVLLAGVLIVLSASMFFSKERGSCVETRFNIGGLGRVGGVLLALIGYYALLEVLGFVTVSFLLMVFFFVFVAKYAWYRALLGAFLSTGLAYLLFEVMLRSNLPKGLLGV